MKTILVWLLFSYSDNYYSAHAATLARFAEAAECERVRAILQEASARPKYRCVQANVIVESTKP